MIKAHADMQVPANDDDEVDPDSLANSEWPAEAGHEDEEETF